MRGASVLVLMLGVLPAAPSDGHAQVVTAGARFEAYTLSRSQEVRLHSVRLLSLPFAAQVAIGPTLTVAVSGAYADATASLHDAGSVSVRGPVDTRVTARLRRDGVSLSAGAILPTGDVVRTASDATVAGALSTDLMPFSVHQWGSGGGFTGDVGYTIVTGRVALGIQAGGSFLSESSLLSVGPASYQPGRELRGRWTLDASIGDAGVLSVLAGYQRFDDDTYGDNGVYRPGSRIEALASYAFPLGTRESVGLFAGTYRLAAGVPQGPAGPFPGLVETGARTLFVMGSEMRLTRGSYDLAPRGELRVLRNATGLGQGWLASIGGHAAIAGLAGLLGGRVALEPSASAKIGMLTAARGLDSPILGFDVGLSVRWGAVR